MLLSSDGNTFIFKPFQKFYPGEQVQVKIVSASAGLRYTYFFTTSPSTRDQHAFFENYLETYYAPENRDQKFSAPVDAVNAQLVDGVRVKNGISLPGDFPTLVPSIQEQQLGGKLFITTDRYAMLLALDGTPYFYHQFRRGRRAWDFTTQANNRISYMVGATAYLFDDRFELLDIYTCGHDYYTDPHEFRYLTDGHVLLIAWDSQLVDMSKLVEGGSPFALVVGTHLQELDTGKEVIFEWRSWDNFDILDARHEDLQGALIHFVHMNAIDVDYDGHLLVSSRHQDEITKINRTTGDIIWRLGGNNNQFTPLNDPDGFNYQHDIRAVPGHPGQYTLYDNGNYHSPRYSRGVEYKIDETAMTVERVWQYRHEPDRYSHWMGNVDRQPNGNTLIGWAYANLPKVTEVTPAGQIVYEADFSDPLTSYRAHRREWSGSAIRPYVLVEDIYYDSVTLLFNTFGQRVSKYYIYASLEENPTTLIDSTSNPYIHMSYLTNYTTYYFRVTSVDSAGLESDFSEQVKVDVQFVQPGENILRNGNFSQDLNHWGVYEKDNGMADWEVDNEGQFHVMVFATSSEPSDVSLYQTNFKLIQGNSYQLEFDAFSSHNGLLEIRIEDPVSGNDYSAIGTLKIIGTAKRYRYTFAMEEPTAGYARIAFNFAYTEGEFFLDNVFLSEVASSVADGASVKTTQFTMRQNYPNPFNGGTSIEYTLPLKSSVTLIFYNISGRIVQRKEYDWQERGEHTYFWIPQNLSSGIYFCRVSVQNLESDAIFEKTIKLICIK